MIALPSYVDPDLWSLFVEGRKEGKHPLTQAGQKLAVRELMKLHNDGWDVNESLKQSTIKGYRGLFPVAKIAHEPTEAPKAYQVSDEHIAKATRPSDEFFKQLKQRMSV
jgi:hypothetical protein